MSRYSASIDSELAAKFGSKVELGALMKILLVDDHPVFRGGMAVLMGTLFVGAQIVETGDMSGLKQQIGSDELPDLVLLDLIFPGFKAAKDFAALRRALPVTPIVAVSMTHDDALIDLVMQAGANGFISKAIHPTHITQALLAIMDGEIVIQRASGGPADSPQDDPMATLTARQIDVLRLIALGLSNKEIGRQLELSPFTVRTHVSAVLKTLDLPSRTAAASFAASRGLG